MADGTRTQALHENVAKLMGREPLTAGFAAARSPFDTSQPNQHESKAEFLAEKNVVVSAIQNIDGLWAALVACDGDDDTRRALSAIRARLDKHGQALQGGNAIETARDLIIKNARETGITFLSLGRVD